MIVKLPRGLEVDIDNIPDDFEAQVQKCFSEYTIGTAEEYTYQDKLSFIDLCVKYIHGDMDPDDAVMCLMTESMEHDLRNGEFPRESDYYSLEYMSYCYDRGRHSQKLSSDEFAEDRHKREKIEMLIFRILKVIVNWEKK